MQEFLNEANVDSVLLAEFEDQATDRLLLSVLAEYEDSRTMKEVYDTSQNATINSK